MSGDSKSITLEDHQRLLRAEEEKVDALKAALATERSVVEEALKDWHTAHGTPLQFVNKRLSDMATAIEVESWAELLAEKQAAESQLEEVAQELERKKADWEEAARLAIQRKRVIEEVEEELEERIGRCEEQARSEPDTGTGPDWQAAHQSGAEHLKSLRTCLQQLLRDKGTEQGGEADSLEGIHVRVWESADGPGRIVLHRLARTRNSAQNHAAELERVEAQRDQLDQQVRELERRLAECYHLTGSDPEWEERAWAAEQQVRELLSAADAHRAACPITYDRELIAAADKVRKERGE